MNEDLKRKFTSSEAARIYQDRCNASGASKTGDGAKVERGSGFSGPKNHGMSAPKPTADANSGSYQFGRNPNMR